MPRQHAETWDPPAVEKRLHDKGLTHLRARKHGAAVIVESGPDDEPLKHFRLRRDTVHLWWLDMAARGSKWERTPFRGQRDELVDMVIESKRSAPVGNWIISITCESTIDSTIEV
jgi:hypothetical protein